MQLNNTKITQIEVRPRSRARARARPSDTIKYDAMFEYVLVGNSLAKQTNRRVVVFSLNVKFNENDLGREMGAILIKIQTDTTIKTDILCVSIRSVDVYTAHIRS